jgi:3'-5' exoribonuclease
VKTAYVADLQPDQAVSTLFLVRVKEIRTSANTGKSWLQLELADRTGTIEAKMWDNFAEAAATFERDDIVKVRARVKVYRGKNELNVEQVLRAAERDYDLEDFLPHTKEDVEQLYARVKETVAGVKSPWLRRLLASVVEDPTVTPKLKRAPAAMTMHHAYIGGLLEHIVSLCGLCRAAIAHYPEADADLLYTGAILHDIGKIEELTYERGIGYSTEGELLGHIVIALALVRKKIEAIEGFPPELCAVIEHLIVSHHGTLEFGSPRPPMVREAVLLNHLDDLDSKMAAMRATLTSPEGEGEWTAKNPSLRRALLRTEEYLRGKKAEDKAPTPATGGKSQTAKR